VVSVRLRNDWVRPWPFVRTLTVIALAARTSDFAQLSSSHPVQYL
jgi:hypothetical protein